MWLPRRSALVGRHVARAPRRQPRQPRRLCHCSDPDPRHGPLPKLQPSAAMNYCAGAPRLARVPSATHPANDAPPSAHPGFVAHAQQHHSHHHHQQEHQQHPSAIPGLVLAQAVMAQQPLPATAGPSKPAAAQPAATKGKKRKSARAAAAAAAASSSASAARNARDERQPPSQASGGIPEPTAAYLAHSLLPPAALVHPRRILVILDLNGTLLYRPARHQPTSFVERPHARRFLAYCLDAFYLAIWSSARPDNVYHMIRQLLTPAQQGRCIVIWGRDRFGLSPDDYNTRVQCYKRLSAIWENPTVQISHPAASQGGRWDQSNTVLVDDSPEKGRSEPHNILPVSEFSGPANETVDVLPQVHDYLNALCYQQDISRYMRQTPFRLDPNYRLPPAPAHDA